MADNTAHIVNYKTILRSVIEQRPSGMSQRLSEALGKNRSFISQISNPAYRIPVPFKHLEIIFTVCGFSTSQRKAFLDEYYLAHPKYKTYTQTDKKKEDDKAIILAKTGNVKLDRDIEKAVLKFTDELVAIYKKHTK